MCTSLWHAINSWREVPAHAEFRARSYSALPLPCGYAGTCLIQQTYISAWSGSFLYMQRKYCRSVLNHKDKMYKGFDVWLRKNYPEGKPTGLQLQSALAEDDAFFYPPADLESQQNSPSYTEMPRDMSIVSTLEHLHTRTLDEFIFIAHI